MQIPRRRASQAEEIVKAESVCGPDSMHSRTSGEARGGVRRPCCRSCSQRGCWPPGPAGGEPGQDIGPDSAASGYLSITRAGPERPCVRPGGDEELSEWHA